MEPEPASTEDRAVQRVPLASWEAPHPVTAALLAGQLPWPQPTGTLPTARSARLATALAEANAALGNPVEDQLQAWLDGAVAVVTGQQPGLLGGPLLSLVKACAVAAEVGKLRAAGTPAVGFFWLETRDDDLPEMGWARLFCAGELLSTREGWQRSDSCCASAAVLSAAVWDLLERVPVNKLGEEARQLWHRAREAFAPGQLLGQACARLLAHLFRPLGLVLVDANLPEVAQAASPAAERVASRLPQAWQSLHEMGERLSHHQLPMPLRLRPDRLPFFRLRNGRRESQPASALRSVLLELARYPEAFSPNVWLRPVLQDAALATHLAILGSAELAYHWVAQEIWELAGVPRPRWQLRPHLTLVGPAERRLVAKLGLCPDEILRVRLPQRLLPHAELERQLARLAEKTSSQLERFARQVESKLPAATAEVHATQKRLQATYAWLLQRLSVRREQQVELQRQRFAHLVAALRPDHQAQERALSLLSPCLSVKAELPVLLTQALRQLPPGPDMLLLYWREGGLW